MSITNLNWIANCLGFISLLGSMLVFTPAIANLFSDRSDNTVLSIVIRWGIIIALFTGLSHGLLMTQKEDINFYDLRTYWTYAEGLLTFNLLIFLAFSFATVKFDLKKAIYLIYALLFLLSCHISSAIA